MTDDIQTLKGKILTLLRGDSTHTGLVDPLGDGRESNAKINAWIHGNNPAEKAQLPRVSVLDLTANYGPVGIGNPNGMQECFIRIKMKTKENAHFDRVQVYGSTSGSSFLHKLESKIRTILEAEANYGEWSGIGWSIPISISGNFFESAKKEGLEKIIDYRFLKFCT